MSITLYRKYRPQTFEDLAGQRHIKEILQSEIKSGKIAHAYLFCGPRGIGKTTTARILAKAVNCANLAGEGGEPCNQCGSCQEISAGRCLDLIEIDAASNRGINEIRELKEKVRFAPSKNKYKVFIIDEVHMLTTEAFNALLKTLEEPPKHAIFILATTEIHKVPETIISRCQRFDFYKIKTDDLIKRLEKIVAAEGLKVEKEVLETIAWRSEGCSRDAEGLLGQILALGGETITADQANLIIPRSNVGTVAKMAEHLIKKEGGQAIALVNKLINEGVDVKNFTFDLIEFLRKLLLSKITGDSKDLAFLLNVDGPRISSLSDKVKTEQLVEMISLLIEQVKGIEYAEIPQLPLELAITRLCLDVAVSPKKSDGEKEEEKQSARQEKLSAPPADFPVKTSSDKEEKSAEEKPKAPIVEKESIPAESKDIKEDGKVDKTAEDLENLQADGIILDNIAAKWNEILSKVGTLNYSLLALLKVSKLLSLQRNALCFGFPYKFHQERLKERKNRQVLEDVLKEMFGERISVESKVIDPALFESQPSLTEVSAAVAEDKGEKGEFLNNILKDFGGEVVD